MSAAFRYIQHRVPYELAFGRHQEVWPAQSLNQDKQAILEPFSWNQHCSYVDHLEVDAPLTSILSNQQVPTCSNWTKKCNNVLWLDSFQGMYSARLVLWTPLKLVQCPWRLALSTIHNHGLVLDIKVLCFLLSPKPRTCHSNTLRCRAQVAIASACRGSDLDTVTHGTCMSTDVADILVPACYEAGASYLEVTGERRTQLQGAMVTIHDDCTAATKQVRLFSQPAEPST